MSPQLITYRVYVMYVNKFFAIFSRRVLLYRSGAPQYRSGAFSSSIMRWSYGLL